MKIYTRTGDSGETGLIGGGRAAKSSPRIKSIGEVDELNAVIGVARTMGLSKELDSNLESIQNRLFDLGATLATPLGRSPDFQFVGAEIDRLEAEMDQMTASLPPLTQFILPGGSPGAAQLHLCRVVCRRAERTVAEFVHDEPAYSPCLRFLNRLSDWLFVAARTANADSNVVDIVWKKLDR